jgi:hypothetical protein
METPGFTDIPGVRRVPVVADWRALTRREFVAKTDVPMLFQGLGTGTKAIAWDREFLRALGGARLRDFLAALDAGEHGVYASEWYLFKEHPELLADVVADFPEYLLDDWLESIPPPLSFDADTRNNVYWGAHGSATPIHYDSFNGCTWNVTLKGVKRWLLLSAREFAQSAPQCWSALETHGLVTDRGLFTPETVRRYLAAPPDGFPAVTFYAADVGAGDAIYVPWGWAHQVQNIGEALACSRFYVSEENFDAFVRYFRTSRGPAAATLLRTVIGTRPARALFRRPRVRAWLKDGRASAPLRAWMQRAMKAGSQQPAPGE